MKAEQLITNKIREHRDRLSVAVIESMFTKNTELRKKYHHLFERLVSDVQFHFDYVSESIHYTSYKLLSEYAGWLIVFFRNINVPINEIKMTFHLMQEELNKLLDDDVQSVVNHYFKYIHNSLSFENNDPIPSFIQQDNPHKTLANSYFTYLLNHKRREATELLISAIEKGVSIKDIYLHVFQKSQWEIGRLWQTNKLSVAQEHCFTAATQSIMSQLYPYMFGSNHSKGKVVAACVGRELHEIGIRMVADFFEMDGWDTIYIGANTPTKTLIDTITKERPDILALSTTIVTHLKQMEDIISAIREKPSLNYMKIIVGGYPFNQEYDLWRQLNSDGFAPDAERAVDIANKLVSF